MREKTRMAEEDWQATWQPMVEAVGRDFAPDEVVWGADPIEASAVRRYLEPLEFDCPLHYDEAAARAHGYDGVVAPNTSLLTFALPALWQPGEAIFASAERDAQPTRSPVTGRRTALEPPTTGYFATDFEMDYLRPVVVGDRIGRRGARLVACAPKETTVGRGAFLTWESEMVNQRGEVVARLRLGTYRYQPYPEQAA